MLISREIHYCTNAKFLRNFIIAGEDNYFYADEGMSLIILPVTEDRLGTYTCTAQIPGTDVEASLNIILEYSGTFICTLVMKTMIFASWQC